MNRSSLVEEDAHSGGSEGAASRPAAPFNLAVAMLAVCQPRCEHKAGDYPRAKTRVLEEIRARCPPKCTDTHRTPMTIRRNAPSRASINAVCGLMRLSTPTQG